MDEDGTRADTTEPVKYDTHKSPAPRCDSLIRANGMFVRRLVEELAPYHGRDDNATIMY